MLMMTYNGSLPPVLPCCIPKVFSILVRWNDSKFFCFFSYCVPTVHFLFTRQSIAKLPKKILPFGVNHIENFQFRLHWSRHDHKFVKKGWKNNENEWKVWSVSGRCESYWTLVPAWQNSNHQTCRTFMQREIVTWDLSMSPLSLVTDNCRLVTFMKRAPGIPIEIRSCSLMWQSYFML